MAMLQNLAQALQLPVLHDTDLHKYIAAGVDRLARFQRDDGNFALWIEDQDSAPFLTAFALYGYLAARDAGYSIPQDSLDRGTAALKAAIASGATGRVEYLLGEQGSRALALYVLARLKQPDPGAMAKLYDQRADLPLYGEAFLAMAMHEGGGAPDAIRALEQDVLSHAAAVASGQGGMVVAEPHEEGLGWYMSSTVRTTSLALEMLLEIDPSNRLVGPLARGILASRVRGRWEDTQDSLFALEALAKYARARSSSATARHVRVSYQGKTLLDSDLGAGSNAILHARIPMSELKPGTLTIEPLGGTLSYEVRLRYAQSVEHAPAVEDGFEVSRSIVDPDTNRPVTAVHAGALVKVVLTARSSTEREYVALVDRLPAGLEPVNPKLATSSHEDDSGHSYGWNAIEMHDDRVAVFADHFWPDWTYEYSYLARATTSGTFLEPPAAIHAMYQPEVRARTESATIEIEP